MNAHQRRKNRRAYIRRVVRRMDAIRAAVKAMEAEMALADVARRLVLGPLGDGVWREDLWVKQ